MAGGGDRDRGDLQRDFSLSRALGARNFASGTPSPAAVVAAPTACRASTTSGTDIERARCSRLSRRRRAAGLSCAASTASSPARWCGGGGGSESVTARRRMRRPLGSTTSGSGDTWWGADAMRNFNEAVCISYTWFFWAKSFWNNCNIY